MKAKATEVRLTQEKEDYFKKVVTNRIASRLAQKDLEGEDTYEQLEIHVSEVTFNIVRTLFCSPKDGSLANVFHG